MNGKNIEKKHYQTFDNIKETGPDGAEFWMARQLSKILDYAEFRNFLPVIGKAKKACENSGQQIKNHFVEMHEMVSIGSGAERKMESYALSRYACYLIVQNGDPSKPVIANGQTYFAIQTRRQELADDEAFQRLREEEKRLFLRNEMREHNKQLVETAQQAGVESIRTSPSFTSLHLTRGRASHNAFPGRAWERKCKLLFDVFEGCQLMQRKYDEY